MSDIAIRVEKLSKQYKIGSAVRHDRLKDLLTYSFNGLFRRPQPSTLNPQPSTLANPKSEIPNSKSDFIWALKDTSFEVKKGEVLGIIGRNGAGKSTLLKILSRITEPTAGRAEICGRVGSLLEVGTGFHVELTGRENIYLNGAILGMRKTEIDRKFAEIVDFSGVERFIDTPVKRYSSGMKVRLAFAVAAHLDLEVLLVDEVLAVGDAEFQKKCLGKMRDVTAGGRTVLFVSHNMAAVQTLCTRAIYLRDGRVVEDAPVNQAIASYLNWVQQDMHRLPLADRVDRVGSDQVRIVKVEFLDGKTGAQMHTLLSGQDVLIRIHFVCLAQQPIDNVSFAIKFFALNGTYLFACDSEAVGVLFNVAPGVGTCVCRILKWPLTAGRYTFNLVASRNSAELDWVKEAGCVDVETGNFYGTTKIPGRSKTAVLIDYQWESPRLEGKQVSQ